MASGADAALWRGGAFQAGPYLVYLGQQQFSIAFVADVDGHPIVEWWRATEDRDDAPARRSAIRRSEAHRQDGIWTVTLGPLSAAQRIGYRVVLPNATSEVYHFRAGPRPGKPFRFIVYGDTRTHHLVHWRVINAMAQQGADFVIHTGDFVENGSVEEEWLTFFSIVRPVAARAPFIPAFGNHDLSPDGKFRRFFLLDRAKGSSGRAVQLEQRFYTRDWGRLRMIVFDPEIEYRPGSTQYQFVSRMMADAAKRDMYIVLVSHKPPYSSGEHGSYAEMRAVVRDLGSRYGVELMVSGHDHNYERTKEMNGMTFIVSGGGGAPIHPVDPQNFSAAVRTEPHYVVVDVDDTGLALRAINLSGEVFDSYLVKPNPPRMALARGATCPGRM